MRRLSRRGRFAHWSGDERNDLARLYPRVCKAPTGKPGPPVPAGTSCGYTCWKGKGALGRLVYPGMRACKTPADNANQRLEKDIYPTIQRRLPEMSHCGGTGSDGDFDGGPSRLVLQQPAA